MTVAEIVARSLVSEKTVYRKIEKMKQAGLVEVQGKGYKRRIRRVQGADLSKAAEIIGTAGAGDKQRARHKAERAAVGRIQEAYRESLTATKH